MLYSIYNHIQEFLQRLFGQAQRSQCADSRRRSTSGTWNPVSNLILLFVKIMVVTSVLKILANKTEWFGAWGFYVCVVVTMLLLSVSACRILPAKGC